VRNLFLILLLVLIATSVSAFDGQSTTFKELGYSSKVLASGSNCFDLQINNWEQLKAEEGILGTMLHVNMPSDERSKFFLKNVNGETITYRSIYGVRIAFVYKNKNLQDGKIFINLEQMRDLKGELQICGYPVENETITIFDNSEIGSYKIPYFGCEDCFKKKPVESKYKVNEPTPIKVEFTNKGYADTNLEVFYDNEIFQKWFLLGAGQPKWNGNLDINEEANFEYMFTPLIGENFVISPAVMTFSFDGYKFEELSNLIIVGTKPYLDTIICEYAIDRHTYEIGETANIELILYNDSASEKVFNVSLNDETTKVLMNSQESKTVLFEVSKDDESIDEYQITLTKDDLSKTCGNLSLAFTESKFNYIPYIILLLVLIAIGTFVYYYYFI